MTFGLLTIRKDKKNHWKRFDIIDAVKLQNPISFQSESNSSLKKLNFFLPLEL